ncbi:MAG: SDR family oxidoreductase [Chloroflexi bacterium]|nr:MAG: SDR family oxidoreductase [Chloroflexota bacterium]
MDSVSKTILITGATSGIGRAAAVQLSVLGHSVVLVGRDQGKCISASNEIYQKCGRKPTWLLADLSSMEQVRSLAREFLSRFERLDVLINNAGAVYIRRIETPDGLEMGWAVNYFQSFLLTHLLLDKLKASAPSRIVNLSSNFHWAARLNLDNLNERGRYIGWNVYARTKLASLYFTYELSRRLEGSSVTANAVHPGLVATGMGKTSGWLLKTVFRIVDLFAIPPEKGAQSLVFQALDPSLSLISGKYFSGTKLTRSSPISYDVDNARYLWERSWEITGI